MTFRDDILETLDDVRGLPAELGLRTFSTVEVVTVAWSGGRPGVGTKTTTRVALGVAGGAQPPKVRTMTQKEVVASGGEFTDEMYEVGPLTPSYGTGGTLISDLRPNAALGTEVLWHLVGPGGADIWCKTFEIFTDRALSYKARIKRTGETPQT